MNDEDLVTYEFAFDVFNGPLSDKAGVAVYIILTQPSVHLGHPVTTITRRDGGPVAEVHQGRWLRPTKVYINGEEQKNFLQRKRRGLWGGSRWTFRVNSGEEMYWDDLKVGQGQAIDYSPEQDIQCFMQDGSLVARYTRQIEHVDSTDEHARLSVAARSLPHMDHILITAVVVEAQRRRTERNFDKTIKIPSSGNATPTASRTKFANIEGHTHAPHHAKTSSD